MSWQKFATFFASTANLGRQNKTDLVGLAGLLCGFAYGVVAAFLTSRVPQFPLLLRWCSWGSSWPVWPFKRSRATASPASRPAWRCPSPIWRRPGRSGARSRRCGRALRAWSSPASRRWSSTPLSGRCGPCVTCAPRSPPRCRTRRRVWASCSAPPARRGKGRRRAWATRSYARAICSTTPVTCPAPSAPTRRTMAF